jgi:hypothetical protein
MEMGEGTCPLGPNSPEALHVNLIFTGNYDSGTALSQLLKFYTRHCLTFTVANQQFAAIKITDTCLILMPLFDWTAAWRLHIARLPV